MEIMKKSIRFGNSAGVILPKGWENKKVRVEIVEDSLPDKIFEIIREENLLSDVIGIYLVGSYARGEETLDSDVDFLIITGKTNKEIKKGNYEILFISKEKIEKNLEKSLYLYSMVKEAKTILNDSLIKSYKGRKPKLPLNKMVNEIKSILKINKESVELSTEKKFKIIDGIAYSVVLRLRELFLIKCLLKEKKYTNKEFLRIVVDYGSEEIYRAYLRIKNELKPRNNLNKKELLGLISYSEKLIKEVKNGKKRKKN